MDHLELMKELALKCTKHVIVPENTSCCGFAGDRGLIIPKLTINAIEKNREMLLNDDKKLNGYSTSRMCEIGLSTTDHNYVNIALLVQEYLLNK
jgi:D-lactate dehydrogenase